MSFFAIEFREAEDRSIEISTQDVLDFLGLSDLVRGYIRKFDPILKHIISDPIRAIICANISSFLNSFTPSLAWQIPLSDEVISF